MLTPRASVQICGRRNNTLWHRRVLTSLSLWTRRTPATIPPPIVMYEYFAVNQCTARQIIFHLGSPVVFVAGTGVSPSPHGAQRFSFFYNPGKNFFSYMVFISDSSEKKNILSKYIIYSLIFYILRMLSKF